MLIAKFRIGGILIRILFFLKVRKKVKYDLVVEVKILNRLGLHARPAALVAQCASRFKAVISLTPEGGSSADAKSILSLLMLGSPCGTVLKLEAVGCDEADAAEALTGLFAAKFDED